MEMDRIDGNILRLLQENADIANARLAEQVGLSPSACLRRVARLRRDGVIQKTVAVLDPARIGRPLTAIISVEFTRHGSEHRKDFVKKVLRNGAIRQCYLVTGEVSCILTAHMRDMDEYLAITDQLFDSDPNVTSFRTYIAMQTVKDTASLAF
ncbi:MAG: Lrp/AsnC family transcriptional regulator [Pseudomonadota bacterium]